MKVMLFGEETWAVKDPLHIHKQLHRLGCLLGHSLSPSPPHGPARTQSDTHTHTCALAPWAMKMDDEHLAKQGCGKLRR